MRVRSEGLGQTEYGRTGDKKAYARTEGHKCNDRGMGEQTQGKQREREIGRYVKRQKEK
jgi:hypothetical protein